MVHPIDYRRMAGAVQQAIGVGRVDGNVMTEFDDFLSEVVVLDTGGPVVYLGKLEKVTESAFVLTDADVHDARDGHATNETYVSEARRVGISVNRRRVIVMRSTVMSVSRLEDVVEE